MLRLMQKNEIKSISYYDKKNKRYKQVDVTHTHKVDGVDINPHTNKGYMHDEKGTYRTSTKEDRMVERVKRIWYYHLSK